MPPIISELIKITVAQGFKLDSPNFAQLRNSAVANGVKEQYYGNCTDTPNTLLWVIRACFFPLAFWTLCFLPLPKEWLSDKGPLESPEFRNAVKLMDVKGKPESYYLPFPHDSLPRPALTAPVCELVRPPIVR